MIFSDIINMINVKLCMMVVLIELYPFIPLSLNLTPQWGAVDAKIKVPFGENTELKRSPFKAWGRSVYSHTCYAYCKGFFFLAYYYTSGPFTCIFPETSPDFSCVGCC